MKIVIGAGGTGGHVFPAQALAREVKKRGGSVILFTDDRGARFISDFPAEEVVILPNGNIRQGSPTERLKAGSQLLAGVGKALSHLKNSRSDATVGFGGYPSFPAGVASFLLRKPLYLHEQNVILGKTNRFLGRFAKKILLSFPNTKNIPNRAISVVTGNPIRENIYIHKATPYTFPVTEEFRILITGGSQGARFFTEFFPQAFELLPLHLKKRLLVVHQAGGENPEALQKSYENAGVRSDIRKFIDNMGEEITRSALCVARAGASSISELTAIGRPAILIPLPTAADDQQTLNAKYLAENSAGVLAPQSDLTPKKMAVMIEEYMNTPHLLEKIAHQAKLLGQPDAVKNIYQEIENDLG